MTAPARKIAALNAAVSLEGGSDASATVVLAFASTARAPAWRARSAVNPPHQEAASEEHCRRMAPDRGQLAQEARAARNCTQIVYSAFERLGAHYRSSRDLLDLGGFGLAASGGGSDGRQVDLRSLDDGEIIRGEANADADGGEDEDVDARHPPCLSMACGAVGSIVCVGARATGLARGGRAAAAQDPNSSCARARRG